MNNTADSVWKNCLSFIKDNIQPQAYKTWFEPIVAIKLTDLSLSIQVPSKFFYEWLEEHYVKILKVALTKELGDHAKLVYIIKMENTYGNNQPFTEKIPSANRSAIKSQQANIPLKNKNPQLKNPFVIPGIRNIKIESQLNPRGLNMEVDEPSADEKAADQHPDERVADEAMGRPQVKYGF